VRVDRVWLTDFRNYTEAELAPAAGLTAIVGSNGEGKTNLLEAIGYLATLSSFRGAPGEALVRMGRETAVVRAELHVEAASVANGETRAQLVEAELRAVGRDRVLVNRQPLKRARDLLGTIRVTVFSPDDLELIKGGPAERRRYVDETLVACSPRHDATRSDLDRILRQRTTLLKQAGGRLTPEIEATLDVWDAKLAEVGEVLGAARQKLVERLEPVVAKAYDDVASTAAQVTITYDAPWRAEGLAAALAAARRDDVRRAVSTVGPHRDELVCTIDGLPSRTHASQGEQRSLALALRLGSHSVVTEVTGTTPVLLLDDVFSELDAERSHALLEHLPPGQSLLTTAGPLPEGVAPELVVRVSGGRIVG
jgi:DNA replication and repair protein RecF